MMAEVTVMRMVVAMMNTMEVVTVAAVMVMMML